MTAARPNSGFSMIEVMCAMLILGVALTGLVHGLTAAVASSKESPMQTAAALFAAGQIEQTRADESLSDGDTDGDCGDVLPQCHWSESIAPADVDGLHEVTVTISSARSGESIYELKTLLFDPDYPSQTDTETKSKPQDKNKQRQRRNQ